MYSNGSSLNLALFILMANHLLPFVSRITLQLLGVKLIPCRVVSLIDIQLKQKDWGQSKLHTTKLIFGIFDPCSAYNRLLNI